MRILDRYILRSFFIPFIYCFLGFLAIWLVFDLTDNGPDFLNAKTSPLRIAQFYVSQIPQIIVLCLPVGLLLALLFSLGRLSRSNEIISMLGAGRSMPRILFPLIAIGILATGISMLLNYKWAPKSEAYKKELLNQIVRGKPKNASTVGILFRNRVDARTWYVQKAAHSTKVQIREDLNPLEEIQDLNELQGVHITQQDSKGNILSKYYARRATYNPTARVWNFERGKTVNFDIKGNVISENHWPTQQISNWSETLWRVTRANLDAQNLSVPELKDYLYFNADFPPEQLATYRTQLHYRWALPWTCFVVILIASPLGIVYSRRGVLGGVATSIFIFFGMMFLSNLFLALGKGYRIPALLAAWSPNFIFGVMGLVLLYLRATNRAVPKLGGKSKSIIASRSLKTFF